MHDLSRSGIDREDGGGGPLEDGIELPARGGNGGSGVIRPLAGGLHQRQQHLSVEGLADHFPCSAFIEFRDNLEIDGRGGLHHHRHRLDDAAFAQKLKHRPSVVFLRHDEVKQDGGVVVRPRAQHLEGLGAARSLVNLEVVLEYEADKGPRNVRIVDDQNQGLRTPAGYVMRVGVVIWSCHRHVTLPSHG